MARSHSRSSAVLFVLSTLAALALAADADIPGVTRPTSTPTATLAVRDDSAPPLKHLHDQCNPDQPDSCAAVDLLAIQREDDQHVFKRQEPGEEPTSRVINVPQNAPNGGLSMTQPPITAQATVCPSSVMLSDHLQNVKN